MSAAIDYRSLLTDVQPKVIFDEVGHQHALSAVEKLSSLLEKVDDPTEVENMIELLATLIEKYEQDTIRFSERDPVRILTHLMEARGMSQQQFADSVGLSSSHVSNILSGARTITVDLARKLGTYSSVAPSLFLGIE